MTRRAVPSQACRTPSLGNAARRGAVVLVTALMLGPLAPAHGADEADSPLDVSQPTGHFAIEHPANLPPDRAERIYQRVLPELIEGYGISHLTDASGYAKWQRFNRTPYRSAQHGERFVNNYGNRAAAPYSQYEAAGTLPQGAILAKDSFTVTEAGGVFSGALFLMEKMEAGFYPEARDWRYTMILPDGSLFGTTKGEGSEQVEFCIDCHQAAGDAQDHLFLIPEAHRR